MCQLTKIIYRKDSQGGRSRSMVQSCGCDQEGKILSWKTGFEEVGFEVFHE